MQPMREPKRSQEEEQERPKWNQSYTVGKPARKLKPRQNEKESYAFLCMIKCTVAGILTCAVLCCLVASKVSVLVLGQIYRDAVERGKSDTVLSKKSAEDSANATTLPLGSNNAVKEAVFVMLVLILIIPQAVSLIVAAWVSLFQKSHPWPSKAAIAWILFGGLLEVACLSYLCLCTLTVYDVPLGLFVLLMSALFIIPTLWQAIKIRRFSNTKYGRIRLALFVFAAVLLIGGLVVLAYQTITHTHARIGVPVAFFVLSYAWSPQIRELQTQPKRLPRARDELSDVTTSHQEQDLTSPSLKLTKKMARDKAAILISLWKIILTPFVCALLCHLYSIAELSSLRQGFLHIASFRPALDFFLLQIFSTFLGYHLAWLACSMCMQKAAFALPLTFCTPIVVVLVTVKGACGTSWIPLSCSYSEEHFVWIIALGLSMWVGQFLSTGYYVWKNQGFVMAKASFLFWIPSYNGLMLEQNLLLNRRNEVTDESHVTQKVLKRDTHVFICTTMYHEADYEMEQLLNSLHDVDRYRRKARRHIESHVFFDGCIKSDELNSYILQLVSLVESTLRIPLNKCTKMKTPYGMQLRWKLPGGMPFTIHLKDNNKVKNKKRWSQVMYMSYVVDFKRKIHNIRDDQTFILTTDADVNFKHESMEALIDYMLQDEKVGAVCGRTHPMGKGPLVWYQIFDYAIGHWFQKVANHMLGSVLCCPGCFSLYRCKAVKDILPEYSTNVNEASEFLTKDMGEDRWMCTLMVQAGWRLLYCAAAEDVTYCPTTFDEFYNQRRRWMPSTLANLILLISEWRLVVTNNDYISVPFIIFQLILLLATVIGPSTVILVITGGMNYVGIATNEVTTVTIMSLITLAFGLICLFTSQSFQLLIAKLLTFAFSIVMLMVAVGVAVQISKDLEKREAARNSLNSTSTSDLVVLPASVSTLYLGGNKYL